jgi:uncharacterized protein YlzI (FlbEa/FlbD family)
MISLTLNIDLASAKRGTILDVFPDKILGVMSMPTTGTVLIMNGGATIAVRESKEEILNKITAAQTSVAIINKET